MEKVLKISVAMGTYNGEAYLREQLNSILDQTVLPYELVVCDDASTDRTATLLNEFRENCPFPVIVISNPENVGFLKNFENVIGHCSGDIIALADQDDIWHTSKLKTVRSTFIDNPLCGYVFSNADLIDDNGTLIGRDLWASIGFDHRRLAKYANRNRQLEVMLKGGNFVYGTTMAFRASYRPLLLPIESNSFECAHDTWVCLMLSAVGAYGVALPQPLIKYRQHGSQLAGAGQMPTFSELIRKAYRNVVVNHDELSEALETIVYRLRKSEFGFVNSHWALKLLAGKVVHLRARSQMARLNFIQKVCLICRELFSGRYALYSRPFSSSVKDLVSR